MKRFQNEFNNPLLLIIHLMLWCAEMEETSVYTPFTAVLIFVNKC